jgi:hypothetical protein
MVKHTKKIGCASVMTLRDLHTQYQVQYPLQMHSETHNLKQIVLVCPCTDIATLMLLHNIPGMQSDVGIFVQSNRLPRDIQAGKIYPPICAE